MHKAVFTIGDDPKAYIGYTDGQLWNGWATPHFELSEARKVMLDYNLKYDDKTDTFIFSDDDDIITTWQGYDIQTQDGTKHLYDIGAYSWVWDTYSAREVALAIDEFIWEWDPYSYMDIFSIRKREEVVAELTQQLSPQRIKQVIEILNSTNSAESTIEELAKIISL